tara:strand:+ start:390 stop:644 length:255 start_codon:yes stop_codon:yes gene_type:complete
MIDERVELPKALKHLVFATFGVSGLVMMIKGGSVNDYTDSLLLLAGGIFSAFATYGLASLVSDIKKAKSLAGLWKMISDKFKIH